MNNEDIEKLKQAAFKLAEIANRNSDDVDEWNDAIAAVEAFKPEPEKPIECWVNVYQDGAYGFARPTKELAVEYSAEGRTRTACFREVVPVEWERWTVNSSVVNTKTGLLTADGHAAAIGIVLAHNEAMQRVTGTEGK